MLITNVVTADCDEIRRLFLDEIGTARSRREHQRASLKKVVGQRHVEPFDWRAGRTLHSSRAADPLLAQRSWHIQPDYVALVAERATADHAWQRSHLDMRHYQSQAVETPSQRCCISWFASHANVR